MINRRSVLKGTLVSGLSYTAKRVPLGALILAASKSPAKAAYWVAALAAAQVVLSILQSFSKSDGGMGAMLRAQNAMLGIIITQLAEIQNQLTNIAVEIKRLEEKIRKIVAENYRDSLINGIGAAAGSYKEVLVASQSDSKTFDNPAVQRRLSDLAQIANTNRNTLAIIPDGYGPETALAVPVACALEVSCSARIGFDKSLIISILNSYLSWLGEMIADRPGSIVRYRASAKADYNAVRLSAIKTRLGQEFQIDNFSLEKNGTPKFRQSGVDYCVLFSDLIKDNGALTVDKAHYMAGLRSATTKSFGNRGGTIYEHVTDLNLDMVPDLKAGQLSFSENFINVIGIAHDGKFDGFEPMSKGCYVRGDPAIFDRDAAIKYALSEKTSADFVLELIKFREQYLDVMNLARARLAFADEATIVVNQTAQRIREQIRFLQGG